MTTSMEVNRFYWWNIINRFVIGVYRILEFSRVESERIGARLQMDETRR